MLLANSIDRSSAVLDRATESVIANLLDAFQSNAYPAMVQDLAEHLGITADSLCRLGIGYAICVPFKNGMSYDGWFVFPERDADGVLVGLSLRSRDDNKAMYPGTSRGLIYEVNVEHVAGGHGYSAGPHNWIRTMDAGMDCPVCGKPDGCLLSSENPADPKAVICIRVQQGAARPMKFGHLHILKPDGKIKATSAVADNGGPVIVVEGASDTAAAMDLGFVAVGRPSNLACMDILAKLLRGRTVIVMGENDRKDDGRWPGKEGAEKAAATLAAAGCDVKIVYPPKSFKDLRGWIVNGKLTADQFLKHVEEHGQAVIKTPNKAALFEDDEFFHDGSTSYVQAKVGDVYEILVVGESAYSELLARRAYERGIILKSQELRDLLTMLIGRAKFDGPQQSVNVRVAFSGNEIYLDLADDARQVVRITAAGWEVIPDADSPFRFIRRDGMLSLPIPLQGGCLSELRTLLNVPNDRDWILICSWLLSLFQPAGLRPILHGHGTQGSAKSESCRKLRRLVDPSAVPDQTLPKSERDLMIAATNCYILAFDNLSGVTELFSDAFCRISSGGGYRVRKNYSDSGEMLFRVQRSILLNGIPCELSPREDFRDRVISVEFPLIESTRRRCDADLERDFVKVWPRVLGALLSAVSMGLARQANVRCAAPPRLADFYLWVLACEPAMPWPVGAFADAYSADRAAAVAAAIENSPVGAAIMRAVETKGGWQGTCADLLSELQYGNDFPRGRFDLPKTPKGVSTAIKRIRPALKSNGVEYTYADSNRGTVHKFFRSRP